MTHRPHNTPSLYTLTQCGYVPGGRSGMDLPQRARVMRCRKCDRPVKGIKCGRCK